MLLQSDLNKLQLRQMSKFGKLFHNAASTRIGYIYIYIYEAYKNEVFTNDAHIHGRIYDAT